MFNIGDKVFKANYGLREKWVVCPDCLGSKHVKVVLGDGTEVTIECGGCYPGGYEAPTGHIRQYDYVTEIREHTVTGVTTRSDSVNYELDNFGGSSYYTGTDKDTFGTKDEAIVHGETQRVEREADENRRLMAKTRDHHSWAWNATYHRKCIKDLERQLEYHRSKAQICASKAKEAA